MLKIPNVNLLLLATIFFGINNSTHSSDPAARPTTIFSLIERSAPVSAFAGYEGQAKAVKDASKDSTLHAAARYHKQPEIIIPWLIGHGADLNAATLAGTALHAATVLNNVPAARVLIEQGADINYKNSFSGSTPLHTAARYGCIEVLNLLIEKKANLKSKDSSGRTPLDFAKQPSGHLTVFTATEQQRAQVVSILQAAETTKAAETSKRGCCSIS